MFCEETIAELVTFSRQGLAEGERVRERPRARVNRQRSSQEIRERGKGRAKEMSENSTDEYR